MRFGRRIMLRLPLFDFGFIISERAALSMILPGD